MTNDNKPPIFGPSYVIDLATYEPNSGKSALMNELMAELAGKPAALTETSSSTEVTDEHAASSRESFNV